MELSLNYEQEYLQAQEAYLQGSYEEAGDLTKELVKNFSDDSLSHLLQANIYYFLNQHDLARKEYHLVLELTTEPKILDCACNGLEVINCVEKHCQSANEVYRSVTDVNCLITVDSPELYGRLEESDQFSERENEITAHEKIELLTDEELNVITNGNSTKEDLYNIDNCLAFTDKSNDSIFFSQNLYDGYAPEQTNELLKKIDKSEEAAQISNLHFDKEQNSKNLSKKDIDVNDWEFDPFECPKKTISELEQSFNKSFGTLKHTSVFNDVDIIVDPFALNYIHDAQEDTEDFKHL